MTLEIVFSAIIAPAFFWAFYFRYKDRFRPEPLVSIGGSYILGILSAAACVPFFALLPKLGIPEDPSALMAARGWEYLAYSIGITGFLEEAFKLIPFLFFVLPFVVFDEKTDGVIYASMIALGFASYENIRCLAFLSGFELYGRAFASPLTHTIFSSIWGYSIGTAKYRNRKRGIPIIAGLSAAALVHGIFNFLTTSAALRVLGALLILVLWLGRIRFMEKAALK